MKVTSRAKRQGTTEEEFDGLTDFLDALEPLSDPPLELVDLALDVTVPTHVRLAARAVLPTALDAAAISAAITALASDEWQNKSAALTLLARADDIAAMLGDILTGSGVADSAKAYLLENLYRIVREQPERARIAGRVLDRNGIDPHHEDILRVYQIRAGDKAALETMIERLEQAPLDIVQAVLASLNSIPDAALGEAVLDKVKSRADAPTDIVGLVVAALNGLTGRITMDGWNSYSLGLPCPVDCSA